MGSWGGSGFAALFGGLMAENVGWRWIFFASAAVSVVGMLMVRGTPESKAAVQRELHVRHDGRRDVHGGDGRAAGAGDPGKSDRLDEPDHARAWRRSPSSLASCSSGPRPQRDHPFVNFALFRNATLHGSDDLEFPVERRRRDAAGVDDARAARRRPVGTGGRDADARLRDRHRSLHPRRREAAAEVRRAQADDLGQPDRWPLDRCC